MSDRVYWAIYGTALHRSPTCPALRRAVQALWHRGKDGQLRAGGGIRTYDFHDSVAEGLEVPPPEDMPLCRRCPSYEEVPP